MQPSLEKHASVPARQNESVPIEPPWLVRIHIEFAPVQGSADFSGAQRQTNMARLAGMDSVDRQPSGFIGGFLENVFMHLNRRII